MQLLKQSFEDLRITSSTQCLKTFLISLNFSLYNYILIKDNLSLHACCQTNFDAINHAHTYESLLQIGIDLLDSYSQPHDHFILQCDHAEIQKALQYIHDHLSEKILLDDICLAIGHNKCYFCTLFKTHTGHTLSSYINNARIELAKKLLLQGSLSLDVVSSQCGFQSYAYFCTTFKKLTGLSPKQFIQQPSNK